MKTKTLIKQKARQLFNELGVKNVTLREVARQLGKSYGNITYYFSTKEKLITELFEDMNQELTGLQILYKPTGNLLHFFLKLPDYNFEITLNYLFFYKDYVEFKRTYPIFFQKVQSMNSARKTKWLQLLVELRNQGYLDSELSIEDLNYIMELSVGIRLFYFQEKEMAEYDKIVFRTKVNRLLIPYLSEKGKKVFSDFVP